MTSWADVLVGVAAVVGAAAWIPQILKWIAKPKLEVLSSPRLGVMFGAGGASVRWPISIAAERQDAVITKIELIITHQNGDRRVLVWGRLEEEITQISIPVPDLPHPIKYEKQSEVFAIKAVTQALTERTIHFYDDDFFLAARDKAGTAKEHFAYLKAQDTSAAESIVKAKEFNQALEFYKRDLFWKEGNYDLTVRLKVRGLKTLHEQKFRFTLSKEDINTLQENLNQFEPFLQNHILDTHLPVVWRYVFPDVSPVN